MPPVDLHPAQLKHNKRVAASRAKLEAANIKMAKAHTLGTDKALQRAAARFLPARVQLTPPRVMGLVRWPYAREQKIRDVPQSLRDSILEEDAICVWCRLAASTTIDHVRPEDRCRQSTEPDRRLRRPSRQLRSSTPSRSSCRGAPVSVAGPASHMGTKDTSNGQELM